jgi:hypothetical protein
MGKQKEGNIGILKIPRSKLRGMRSLFRFTRLLESMAGWTVQQAKDVMF